MKAEKGWDQGRWAREGSERLKMVLYTHTQVCKKSHSKTRSFVQLKLIKKTKKQKSLKT